MWKSWWHSVSVSLKCAGAANLVFWPAAVVGLCLDRLAQRDPNSRWRRLKLQPKVHLSRVERSELVRLAAFNMIFVACLCSPLFEALWDLFQGYDWRRSETDAWDWRTDLLVKLPLQAVITDAWFYGVHSLLHSSTFLYQNVHRVHHRFRAPTAMACVYAHPFEFALGNIFPVYLGPMLTNPHPYSCYVVWFPLAILGTCVGHAGYRLWGHVDPHDVHHRKGNRNLGGVGLLDWLLGTLETEGGTSSGL